MFFTLNRCTLQLNMGSCFTHVLHAEPLHTSAKHGPVSRMFFTLNRFTLQLNMRLCSASLAQASHGEDQIDADERNGEPVPSQCIFEVAVG